LEAVREAFGGQIDCDPASNAKAQERVRALRWYGEGSEHGADSLQNGAQWFGSVWLNPPYGKGLILPFACKLEAYVQLSKTYPEFCPSSHAVLTNLDTSTAWFRKFNDCSDHIVLLRDRVKFIHPITQEPVKDQQRCQILFVRNVNLGPLRRLGSVYARA
jgi:hypothetical protein